MTRFFSQISQTKQHQILNEVFALISKRPETVCNFVETASVWEKFLNDDQKDQAMNELLDSKVIYRHYATLYFVFLVDQSESELGILDLIQVFVEALDNQFENVCELDIIFHFDDVNYILDEVVMGGMVLETNLKEIIDAVEGMKKYVKTSRSNERKNRTKIDNK